jgi:hypothetical protein
MVKHFMKWCGIGNADVVPEYLLHDSNLYAVVWLAWAGGFTVQSDHARSRAVHVAIAASLGLITTQVEDIWFGRTWYITADGIAFMQQYVYINPTKSEVEDDNYIAA